MNYDYPKQYLYRQIVRAKLFIDRHYAEKVDLNAIAETACFSKFHFIRLFKQIYGKTPNQYLADVRVENARQRLIDGESVKQACYSVGFESIGSFSSLFKRRVGKTPAAYQTAELGRKTDISAAPLNHIPDCFATKSGWKK